jgi:hypothetical protein
MPNLATLTHREMLGYWLNDAGLLGDGVEVGSAFGQFAGRIMATWKGTSLHLVDPWDNLPPTEYPENHAAVNFDSWRLECEQLAVQDPRAVLVKKRSTEALPDFKDASLDFVYIDGNHEYVHVMEDMMGWFPKLKRGGLLGGHDFYISKEGGAFCEVGLAVMRWMKERNMNFWLTPACTSWWCLKA